MLKRTLSFVMGKLTSEVYGDDPKCAYITIDRLTALLLLDLLDHLYRMEDQDDGTR